MTLILSKSDILKNPNSPHPPLKDRQIQLELMVLLKILYSDFKIQEIELSDLMEICKSFNQSNLILLTIDDLKSTLTFFRSFYRLKIEINIRNTIKLGEISLQPKIINEHHELFFPFLKKFVEPSEHTTEEIDSVIKTKEYFQNEIVSKGYEVELLVTSAIDDMSEIHDKIRVMFQNIERRLYMMVAFYQDDIMFFVDYLGQVVKNKDIDFKLIYRYDNNTKEQNYNNKKLISGLKEILGENRDFYRAYGRNFIKRLKFRRFIGYLHAKMIIVDDELLCGSANLTKFAFLHNIETAIYTNKPDCVNKAVEFFENLWSELTKPDGI